MTPFSGSRRIRGIGTAVLTASLAAVLAFAGLASPASAALANPLLSVQASPSGRPAGYGIFGTATLGQGSNPTGTITFRLYSPTDPSCTGAPIFTTNVGVNGNAYYSSAEYLTNAAGEYRWTARYNGDANNNPSATTLCSDSGAVVFVDKRRPTLNSLAASAQGSISNTATLANGTGPAGPTGTATFWLFGPSNMTCAGSPIQTSVKNVSGNGSYTSDPFVPTASGTYRWIVKYSGDTNNYSATTSCADPANAVTVTVAPPPNGPDLVASPDPVRPSGRLTVTWSGVTQPTAKDWVALFAAGAPDNKVLAWKYTTGTAGGSVILTVPYSTSPGTYEVRLFANNTVQRLDTTQVTVVA